MPTCPRQHRHEFRTGLEEAVESLGGFLHRQARPQILALSGDPDRAVVGGAGPHAQTANGLHRRVGQSDGIGAECHCLGEVGVGTQTTGHHQGDITSPAGFEMSSGSCQGRDGWNRDVVSKKHRCCTSPAATTVQDDVVDTDTESGVDVVLDVLRRHFHANRDSTRLQTHLIGKPAKVMLILEVLEPAR